MFNFIIYLYLTAVAFSFGYSLYGFFNSFPVRFRQFSVFLGLTLVVEVMGNLVFHALHIKGIYRNEMYNVFALIEFLFYTFFLFRLNKIQWIRQIQIAFMIIFPITWVFLVFDRTSIFQFHGSLIAIGGFFIVCFALAHLYFLSANAETQNIFRIPEFWISIGLVLFYCSQTPYMGAMAYLVKYHLA